MDNGTSFTQIVKSVFSGDIDFSFESIQEKATSLLMYEFNAQKSLIMQILLIIILSAMLKQISQSFSGKSVGDMGFFICYMVLIVVIITTVCDISQMVLNRAEQISKAFVSMVPIFITICVLDGEFTQSAILGASIITGSTAITFVIANLILPTILLTMSMEMADNMSKKPMLSKLIELIKKIIDWAIKGMATLFMLLISLQKISGDAINNIAIKTVKTAVTTVPVVGDVVGGAVDTVANVMGSLRNGTLVGVVIFLLLLCVPILVKLVVIYFAFKIMGAVAEFICEERFVDCIDSSSEYVSKMISVIFLVEGMFIFSVVLILGVF